MYQLIYTSEPTVEFSSQDIRELLAVARARNKISLITGMLVFCDQQFLQVLEGNAPVVIRTYDRIAADARHSVTPQLLARGQDVHWDGHGIS